MTKRKKIFDNFFFNGAEQKTIAREKSAEDSEYLESGNCPLTSYAYSEGGVSGTCDKCGRPFAVNYSEVPTPNGVQFWCAQCSSESVAEPQQLTWNRKSKAIRLG